jgi:DNA (cytosine-5)-methyltransferase 1
MSKNKKALKVLDLFAGAGGFGLGFRLAGKRFKVICSLERDKWAVKTLKANNIEKQKIIYGDIRDYSSPEIIRIACPSRPDIIIGGPPCQGFSYAGTKDPKDPRNSLFKYFVKWVEVLQPKVFILENVRGILTNKNEKGEKVIEIIKKSFNSIGYTINVWELNAANYGVPQNRHRIFVVGNKMGKEISPPLVSHYSPNEKKINMISTKGLKKAVTVIQAIGDLPKLKSGEGEEKVVFLSRPKNNYQRELRNKCENLYNHVAMAHRSRIVKRYEQLISGVSLNNVHEDLRVRKRNGNGAISNCEYSLNYRHLKPNMVAYTIPASFYSNFIHPNQPRNITSREAARLQSFPDDYIFKGKRTQLSSKLLKQLGKDDENYLSQYNQIGNAVPPFLARAIAKRILKFIDEKEDDSN